MGKQGNLASSNRFLTLRLFSVGDLSGFPGAGGRARLLPPSPPNLPDSRQMVRLQKRGVASPRPHSIDVFERTTPHFE
jgi:hypothetical protein